MNVSLICACKNRKDPLIISLNSWLKYENIKEIIIVDWSSNDTIEDLVELDSRIKVIRVNDQEHFNLSHPLNLAAGIASEEYILKVDTDYIINPYYNFFDDYNIGEIEFVSGIHICENFEYWCEETQTYNIKLAESSSEELFEYISSYSPFFKYLKGLLLVKRSHFESIGGYDESIQSYGWEDDNISERLKLFGLTQRKIKNDLTLIHIPHPDKNRYEHCKNYDPEVEKYYENNLSSRWCGNDLKWQTEYIVVQDLIKKNKIYNDIVEYKVDNSSQWQIEEKKINYFHAKIVKQEKLEEHLIEKDMKNKLEGFPKSVWYASLEESVERRENFESQCKEYNIKAIPLVSKRLSESNDIIKGENVYQLNDGTKGCCVSHLKMIKEWYENTDDDYGFFAEDDLSFETVQYWNFSWDEFLETIPDDADCVQLLTIRENYDTFNLRERYWDDWSATAYILTRDCAKKIIEAHIKDDEYHLYVPNQNIMPLIENILFASHGKTYTIPLFVEETNFKSTFIGNDDDVSNGQKNNHYIANKKVLSWWKSIHENSNQDDKKLNVVDCFTYFNEKEIFELRINLLKDYVDKFIVCEANYTFSGNPKEYTLKETIKELGLQDENIEVIEVDLSPENLGEPTGFDNLYHPGIPSKERIQRDALSKCLETNNFDDDCVFIVSDCDEIINPDYIPLMCNLVRSERDKIFKVDLIHFEGRADYRVYNKDNTIYEWRYSLFFCLKEHMKNTSLNDIRSVFYIPYPIVWPHTEPREENGQYIPGKIMNDMGWHFSWMGNNKNRLFKSQSFSHSDQPLDYLLHGKYSDDKMKKFIENYKFEENNIPPCGDFNKIIKPYPIEKLPKIIFDLPRVKNFLLPEIEINENSDIEKLLTLFSLDTENPEHNFNLALWYEEKGHTAPALSYFLRCAERATESDKNLAYEALLHGSHCYAKQGTRDESVRSLLWQAQMFLPHRPEAYYLLARFAQRKAWWQDCYVNSDLCLRLCDFDVPPLRTDVEYPGKYGILYLKAVSAWWWEKGNESRALLQEIKNNHKIREEDFQPIQEMLLNLATGHISEHEIKYDKNRGQKLRFDFKGSEKIERNYSQSFQDLFILTALNGKRNGLYLEIGAQEPFYQNNTALLETEFNWDGISIEIKENLCKMFSEQRKNKIICADATQVDYLNILNEFDKGTVFDYLQLDCEPSEVTYQILLKIPFETYKFAIITYEHDHYVDLTNSYRTKSREYLESKGYKLLVSNVSPNECSSFEDWWYHPDLLDYETVQKLENISEVTDVRSYMIQK
jgi:beta-1,4-mannosyl-glycoprotein beta-1,4-N-acetylglucosaminyltransferase